MAASMAELCLQLRLCGSTHIALKQVRSLMHSVAAGRAQSVATIGLSADRIWGEHIEYTHSDSLSLRPCSLMFYNVQCTRWLASVATVAQRSWLYTCPGHPQACMHYGG